MKQQPMARKLLALCLSLLLVLALSPTAWANTTEGGETPPTNEAPAETAPATELPDTAPAEEETTTTDETTEERTTYVAQIGDKQYETLEAAFNEATTGAVIELLSNVEATGINVTDKTIILNIGTHTITAATPDETNAIFKVTGAGNLTVNGSGSIVNDNATANYHAFRVAGGGTLTIGEGVTVTANQCCVFIRDEGSTLTTSGNLTSSATFAIAGNGSKDWGGTTVTIAGGSVSATNEDGFAIYQPQSGTLNITGGTIIADNPIGIKSGALNISGGSIQATGTYHEVVETYGNGINPSGSAITIDSNGAYAGEVKINITGGTISSENSPAVREVGSDDELVSIDVSENAVLQCGENGTSDIEITNDAAKGSKATVNGGSFSKDIPEKYIKDADLLVVQADGGAYTVGETAEEAVKNAKDTVTVHNGTAVTDVPAGVIVTNSTGAEISVNGKPVSEGENTKIPEPEQPSKPSTPSFTEPEYYPDYDEDVDYLPPVDEEEPEETEDLYMVTCRTLNVRLGGGTGYAKIGTLSRGTVVSGELENGWLKFTYNGQTAYCSADYLAKIDGDLTDMHVTCRTLNVRAGAGTNFEILGTLSRGTEVEILDVLNGWYKIEYLGGEAYVSAAYIG